MKIVKNGIVTYCDCTDWNTCCGCIDFINELQNEECLIKERNRMGIIPNLIEGFKSFITELKRIKIKFFMELKGK